MTQSTELVGRVTVHTAEIALVDGARVAEDDREAARAYVQADGIYPVYVDLDSDGVPIRIRVELTE